jgi:hypothetical protein
MEDFILTLGQQTSLELISSFSKPGKMMKKLDLTEDEWRQRLKQEQYHRACVFQCVACG